MITSARRGRPEIPLSERLRGLLAFRVALVTVLLGGAVALDAHALSGLSNPKNLTLLSLIVGTYLLTILYALGLRYMKDLARLADLQIAGDILISAILIAATGGLDSLFLFVFYLNVITAAVVSGRRTALIAAATATLYFIFLAMAAAQLIIVPAIEAMRTARSAGELIFEVGLHTSAAFIVAILAGYLAEQLGEVSGELERQQSNVIELRALNANILESLNSGLLTVDTQERIIFFNRAAELITGFQANEVYGRPLADVFSGLAQAFKRQPDTPRLENEYTRPGGESVFLGFSVSVLKNSRGENAGRIIIFQDLSEVKKLEQENKRSERLAAVGQLAAAIAHEIRNPLASISGSVEMLAAMSDLEQDDATLMRIVIREVDRLNELITNFLEFSRPRPLNLARADLVELISGVVELFSHDQRNHQLQIALALRDEAGAELAEAPATVDLEAFRQIVWNLLNNAREAISDEAARREIRLQLNPAGEYWRIAIEDSGPGIPDEVAERIFEPFFTTKDAGTGLGLATLHRLVEQHSGRIRVAQAESLGGARFEILLPRE